MLIALLAASIGLLVGYFVGQSSATLPFTGKDIIATAPTQTTAQPTEPAPSAEPAETTEPAELMININTATAEQLQLLPGIGEVIAQRILDYRQEHGPFEKTTDLMYVSGIGITRYEQIMNYICLEDPS